MDTESLKRAKSIADSGIKALAAALAAGKSEALSRYLDTMARFHRYSFGNVLLIHGQCPNATHVAGFHAWRALGRFVKKGEKGIVILAPMVFAKKDADGEDKKVVRFRAVYVFDYSQTDGEPLPEPERVKGDPADYLPAIRALIESKGIALDTDVSGGADGVSRGGRISIRAGLDAANEFSICVHELAHELLHRRDKGEERPCKMVRETEAEAVAFVVSRAIGLETGTASSDYIQLYAGNAETLGASMDRVQKCAAEIIDALEAEPAELVAA
jgi:hypothetical protein